MLFTVGFADCLGGYIERSHAAIVKCDDILRIDNGVFHYTLFYDLRTFGATSDIVPP